ncbi:MAG: hypothetical protein LBF86_04840 [Helicobacteraceae bacterium]|jgi:hypothetical protein|nr:hypothetical protein [Helicobacteraceae bacterium]
MRLSHNAVIAEQAVEAIASIMEVALNQIAQSVKDSDGWLNERQAAEYLGRSLSWLKKRKRLGEFIEGRHFYQKEGILFYRKEALDVWVRSDKEGEITTDGDTLCESGKAVHKSLFERAKDKKGIRNC